MKFFVPLAKDKEQALTVIEATAKFIGNSVPSPTDLIHTVHYKHNGQEMVAVVGEDIDAYYKERAPIVLAIFPPEHENGPIKVCLRDRGVARGEPIYINGKSQFITFQSE